MTKQVNSEATAAIESDDRQLALEAKAKGYDPVKYGQWAKEAKELGMEVDEYIDGLAEKAAEADQVEQSEQAIAEVDDASEGGDEEEEGF